MSLTVTSDTTNWRIEVPSAVGFPIRATRPACWQNDVSSSGKSYWITVCTFGQSRLRDPMWVEISTLYVLVRCYLIFPALNSKVISMRFSVGQSGDNRNLVPGFIVLQGMFSSLSTRPTCLALSTEFTNTMHLPTSFKAWSRMASFSGVDWQCWWIDSQGYLDAMGQRKSQWAAHLYEGFPISHRLHWCPITSQSAEKHLLRFLVVLEDLVHYSRGAVRQIKLIDHHRRGPVIGSQQVKQRNWYDCDLMSLSNLFLCILAAHPTHQVSEVGLPLRCRIAHQVDDRGHPGQRAQPRDCGLRVAQPHLHVEIQRDFFGGHDDKRLLFWRHFGNIHSAHQGLACTDPYLAVDRVALLEEVCKLTKSIMRYAQLQG